MPTPNKPLRRTSACFKASTLCICLLLGGAASTAAPDSPTLDSAKEARSPEKGDERKTQENLSHPDHASSLQSGEQEKRVWHRVRLRVTGSKCTACLLELQKGLTTAPGIGPVKIKPAPLTYMQPMSPDLNNWSDMIFFYDATVASLDSAKAVMRKAGYHAFNIADVPWTQEPTPKDLKF